MTTSMPVTVIVPVYRGVDDVRRCLESVVRHASSSDVAFQVLAIDDASPEPDVPACLDALVSDHPTVPLTVAHNPENLGFVRTVNRGIQKSPGDVVVLNADTVATEGWLDRLAAAACGTDVATVTPLTNFGSICTLPRSVIEAFALEGTDPKIDACADFVCRQSLQLLPEVITGVGFCMYITREALDLCGRFDEDTFGLGYGEEVDFCLRATRIGLRHLVEDSTFVYHHGAGSFGDQRKERLAEASGRLHDRYRFFRAANTRERAQDPLRLPFTALELGLVERRVERPHVLHLLHSPPEDVGGTEKHLRALMKSLLDEFDASILYPVDHGFALRTFWNIESETPFEQEFLLPGGPRRVMQVHDEVAAEALTMALDMFRFDAVHIQNLIGHSLAPLEVLADFSGPVLCSVRDLYLACPNHSLLYRNTESCGVPEDLALCERCLTETRDLPLSYLTDFRAMAGGRLDAVDRWVFASQSAADYFLRVYDVDPERIEIIPHGAVIHIDRPGREVDECLIFDEPLRLAFVGRGWAKKGLAVTNDLADRFADSSVEIHHFGELKDPSSPRLQAHGPFDNETLPELLHGTGIQIVLLPGPYAETFGHVMTEALIAGLPVIGASYGALGERIRTTGAGWTIDPTDSAGIQELIDNLDRCRIEVLRATQHAIAANVESMRGTARRYAELYRPSCPESTPARYAGRHERSEHMSEIEQRLQRHVRAMGAVNRQLQAQVEGGRAWAQPSAQGEVDLLTNPGGSSGVFITGGRRGWTAEAWLEQLAISTEGHKPFLVRLTNGRTFLIDGGYRRPVRSGLLVAALERTLGPSRDVSNDEGDRAEGVPVEVFEGPQGPPFIIVGGKRLPLRGLPLPYPVGSDRMQLFPQGPELNISEANVSRAKFQQAIYGKYQIERARSAIARKGLMSATKAVASRVSNRARRAVRARQ